MARTRAQTAEQLAPLCSAEFYPQLSSDDLLRIVDGSVRGSTHAVATAYAVGDRVVPATPNGRLYRAVRAGTSAATAPDWATEPGLQYTGQRYSDGDDLLWEDDGPAPVEMYDLKLAAQRAWLEKAGRAAADMAVSDQNKSVQLQQVHQHCLEMATRYRPMGVW